MKTNPSHRWLPSAHRKLLQRTWKTLLSNYYLVEHMDHSSGNQSKGVRATIQASGCYESLRIPLTGSEEIYRIRMLPWWFESVWSGKSVHRCVITLEKSRYPRGKVDSLSTWATISPLPFPLTITQAFRAVSNNRYPIVNLRVGGLLAQALWTHASFCISFFMFSGKRDATCPSSPIPKIIRSKTGIPAEFLFTFFWIISTMCSDATSEFKSTR